MTDLQPTPWDPLRKPDFVRALETIRDLAPLRDRAAEPGQPVIDSEMLYLELAEKVEQGIADAIALIPRPIDKATERHYRRAVAEVRAADKLPSGTGWLSRGRSRSQQSDDDRFTALTNDMVIGRLSMALGFAQAAREALHAAWEREDALTRSFVWAAGVADQLDIDASPRVQRRIRSIVKLRITTGFQNGNNLRPHALRELDDQIAQLERSVSSGIAIAANRRRITELAEAMATTARSIKDARSRPGRAASLPKVFDVLPMRQIVHTAHLVEASVAYRAKGGDAELAAAEKIVARTIRDVFDTRRSGSSYRPAWIDDLGEARSLVSAVSGLAYGGLDGGRWTRNSATTAGTRTLSADGASALHALTQVLEWRVVQREPLLPNYAFGRRIPADTILDAQTSATSPSGHPYGLTPSDSQGLRELVRATGVDGMTLLFPRARPALEMLAAQGGRLPFTSIGQLAPDVSTAGADASAPDADEDAFWEPLTSVEFRSALERYIDLLALRPDVRGPVEPTHAFLERKGKLIADAVRSSVGQIVLPVPEAAAAGYQRAAELLRLASERQTPTGRYAAGWRHLQQRLSFGLGDQRGPLELIEAARGAIATAERVMQPPVIDARVVRHEAALWVVDAAKTLAEARDDVAKSVVGHMMTGYADGLRQRAFPDRPSLADFDGLAVPGTSMISSRALDSLTTKVEASARVLADCVDRHDSPPPSDTIAATLIAKVAKEAPKCDAYLRRGSDGDLEMAEAAVEVGLRAALGDGAYASEPAWLSDLDRAPALLAEVRRAIVPTLGRWHEPETEGTKALVAKSPVTRDGFNLTLAGAHALRGVIAVRDHRVERGITDRTSALGIDRPLATVTRNAMVSLQLPEIVDRTPADFQVVARLRRVMGEPAMGALVPDAAEVMRTGRNAVLDADRALDATRADTEAPTPRVVTRTDDRVDAAPARSESQRPADERTSNVSPVETDDRTDVVQRREPPQRSSDDSPAAPPRDERSDVGTAQVRAVRSRSALPDDPADLASRSDAGTAAFDAVLDHPADVATPHAPVERTPVDREPVDREPVELVSEREGLDLTTLRLDSAPGVPPAIERDQRF